MSGGVPDLFTALARARTPKRRGLGNLRTRYVQPLEWWRSLSKRQREVFLSAARDQGVDPNRAALWLRWLDRVHRAMGRPDPLVIS